MTDMRNPQEQTYMCTAKECTKIFTSIDDWRIHVGEYWFEEGHICLHENCGELILISSDELFTHRSHLYLKHEVPYEETEERAKSLIEKNFCSVDKGKIWCSKCGTMELGRREKALDHFKEHVSAGHQIKIPGQTKYPNNNRVRKAEAGASARPANGGEGDIDLSRRGAVAWIDPTSP